MVKKFNEVDNYQLGFDDCKMQLIEFLDDEMLAIPVFCKGLIHPPQSKQEQFTKWLQGTIIFHLNNVKRKLEKK